MIDEDFGRADRVNDVVELDRLFLPRITAFVATILLPEAVFVVVEET